MSSLPRPGRAAKATGPGPSPALIVVVVGSPEVISAAETDARPADPRATASWLACQEDTTDYRAWVDALAGPPEAGPASAPTPEDEAYHLGFRLGMDGEHPRPGPGTDPASVRAFYMGRLAGFIESPDGLAWAEDMRRWKDVPGRLEAIDAMYETAEDRASDSERMEVMGERAAFPRRNDWD